MLNNVELIIIVFLPLLAAACSLLIQNKIFAQTFTTTSAIVSAVCSWCLFIKFNNPISIKLFPWMILDGLKVYWSIYVDSLTVVMLIVVTTVSAIVHLYSIGYMHHDKRISLFFSYLSLFTFFMLALVTSNNFLQLFFGWEGVGLCSYLLIGFWFEKFSANRAAIKAFVVNRVGDFFLLLGIFAIFWVFKSLDFTDIFSAASLKNNIHFLNVFGHKINAINVICILIFIGCMGKSAQIGLHTWLPDAMEGPTPVSALIHAATMVTAGVFLVARCSPLFELSQIAKCMILIVGLITCFFAATVAAVQTDIKKIIAYSTCSQLGYMFMACGASAYNIAIFHLMTHAFFKALLFLCAGNVIHSMHEEQNIYKMGGCWRKIPITYSLMCVGSLALSGIFPFAGYYSKDLIIEHLHSSSSLAFIISLVVALMTSYYSWRLIILVFHGKATKQNVLESPKIMLLPLMILAIGSIFSGMWGVDFLSITDNEFWKNSIKIASEVKISLILKFMPILCSVAGILAAYVIFYKNITVNFIFKKYLLKFLQNKWYFDETYRYLFVKPVQLIANFLWSIIDVKVVDYFGPNFAAVITSKLSKNMVKVQTGYIFDYAFIMLLGTLFVVLWVVYIYIIH